MTRRKFLHSSTLATAGTWLAGPSASRADATGALSDLRLGIIGTGAQGIQLLYCIRDMRGPRIAAVCDIHDLARRGGQRRVSAFRMGSGKDGTECAAYVRAEEMLEKEKLDAVIVAVPDFLHHKYTNLALRAGAHVYCEKPISNSLEHARSMVATQRATGKLLQIGHQRRSNPRFLHARNRIVHGPENLLGWINHVNAHWNRQTGAAAPREAPYRRKQLVEEDLLKEHGFGKGMDGMWRFRNWRWIRGLGSGGPLADLGAHLIDVINWFLDAVPRSVIGSGGIEYFTPDLLKRRHEESVKSGEKSLSKDGLYEPLLKLSPCYEAPDNAVVVFDYEIPQSGRTTRATFQVSSNNASDAFGVKFMGEHGTLKISELPRIMEEVTREPSAEVWRDVHDEGDDPLLQRMERDPAKERTVHDTDRWKLPFEFNERPHIPHLRNFLETIAKGGRQSDLNCPAEEGFRTMVAVLKAVKAVDTGERQVFAHEEFAV